MFSKFVVFTALAIAVVSVAALPKKKVLGCGKYEKKIQATGGKLHCVPDADSCANSPDFVSIACLVSPCTDFKQQCRKAAQCYEDPCNACKAIYYDASFNKVC